MNKKSPVLRENKLRAVLEKGEPTLGTHLQSSWAAFVEAVGNSEMFDYVEFTSVYAPFDLYALENIARAAENYEMSTMIKVDPEPKNFLAQRAVGAGFQSVLFADLRSVDEVKEAIRSVRPEPENWNGCWAHRIEGFSMESGSKRFVDYAKDLVIAIMIEKKPLYDKLEDVLNLNDVDMIQFGPCDFAMSLGVPGEFTNPKVVEAEENTIRLALKYDKHPRVELESGEFDFGGAGVEAFQKKMQRYIDMGVRDFCIGTDIVVFYNWLKQYGKSARKSLGTL
ncbi:MAG: aldolase/citrate lyase family protein [Thermoprotei archaeon]